MKIIIDTKKEDRRDLKNAIRILNLLLKSDVETYSESESESKNLITDTSNISNISEEKTTAANAFANLFGRDDSLLSFQSESVENRQKKHHRKEDAGEELEFETY